MVADRFSWNSRSAAPASHWSTLYQWRNLTASSSAKRIRWLIPKLPWNWPKSDNRRMVRSRWKKIQRAVMTSTTSSMMTTIARIGEIGKSSTLSWNPVVREALENKEAVRSSILKNKISKQLRIMNKAKVPQVLKRGKLSFSSNSLVQCFFPIQTLLHLW